LFFLGILTAVSALQSAGHLDMLARKLDSIIGFLSAIVDNVPLVAGAVVFYLMFAM